MVTHFPESLAPHVTSLVAVVLPAVESIRSNIAKNALVLLREMIRGARRGGGNGRGGGGLAWENAAPANEAVDRSICAPGAALPDPARRLALTPPPSPFLSPSLPPPFRRQASARRSTPAWST